MKSTTYSCQIIILLNMLIISPSHTFRLEQHTCRIEWHINVYLVLNILTGLRVIKLKYSLLQKQNHESFSMN